MIVKDTTRYSGMRCINTDNFYEKCMLLDLLGIH